MAEFGVNARKQRGAGLLLGWLVGLDVFSAWMSSPWSTETFADDPAKRARAKRLIVKSVAQIGAATVLAAWLDAQPFYVVGGALGAGALLWEYHEGLERREGGAG